MKVFITGVTGQLGRTLAKTLKKDHMIIGLARKYAADIEVDKLIIGDLEQPHTFVDEIAECEALILNAAVYRSSGVPIDEYFKVNCQSVNHIFAQLAKISHKVKKAIFISTNAVHDLNQGSPVSEISRFGPSDYYQYSKLLAENIFLDGIKTSGIQGVIIRPGMIWGDLDFRLKKIFNLAQLDPIPLIGNKNPWCHFITFSDLSNCIKKILESGFANGDTFLIAGARAIRLKTLLALISLILGKVPRFLTVPVSILNCIADLIEPIWRLFKKDPPIFRRRIGFFLKHRIFDCSKYSNIYGPPYSKDLLSEISQIMFEYGLLQQPLEVTERKITVFEKPDLLRGLDLEFFMDDKQNLYVEPMGYIYTNLIRAEILQISPKLQIIRRI